MEGRGGDGMATIPPWAPSPLEAGREDGSQPGAHGGIVAPAEIGGGGDGIRDGDGQDLIKCSSRITTTVKIRLRVLQNS